MIVETAMHTISARAGALLLLDQQTEELVFEVAVGGKAETVKRFRVPLGHGIAGLVASTGQPLAVAEGAADSARDIQEQVGYRPESILCVPLFYGDDVIGVLELLDKESAPSFGPEDMETLALFAGQAAVAIELSRVHQSLPLLARELFAAMDDELEASVSAYAAQVERDPAHERALELARLVHEIARRGEHELETCHGILAAFAAYLRERSPGSPAPAGSPRST